MPDIEDRKLTPIENYMRMLKGEIPEWAPVYTMGFPLPDNEPIPLVWLAPPILNPHRPFGGKDVWGVNWVGNYETAGALLPEPGNFIIDDITKWRDVLKAPDYSDLDFEAMAKKDLDERKIDRSKTGIIFEGGAVGFFQQLVAFMGFTEGLCALAEEPEEVEALLDYITTFYEDVEVKCFDYYNPDVLYILDDTAAWTTPFISEEMFRQFFVPCYKRIAKIANDRDIPIQFHNCGRSEHFIEICHEEFNVVAWDPAQISNDLVSFKKRNGRNIAILGGWDSRDRLLAPDVTDEEIVESVKHSFDMLAPDGGYGFIGMFLGPIDDAETARKNDLVLRTASEYGGHFYD